MPPTWTFPQELTDAVIDHLRPYRSKNKLENVDTLRHCSLVAHAWSTRSQQILFKNVTVNSEAACARLRAATEVHPELARNVRNLDLATSEDTVWYNTSVHLDALLAACMQAERITIKCRKHTEVTSLVARIPEHIELRTIMVSHCAFPDPAALRALVVVARARDTLVLNYVKVERATAIGDGQGPEPEPSSIRKLWFHMPTFHGHGAAVGTALGTRAGALRSLYATISHADEVGAVDALLAARGAELEELHIDTAPWEEGNEYDAVAGGLDLNSSPGLHTLVLSVYSSPTTTTFESLQLWRDWITPVLERVRSADSLRHLSIRVHIWKDNESTHLDGFAWGRLDGILSGAPAFSALRIVTFVVLTQEDRFEDVHTVEPIVRTRLPVLNGRGMLRVEYTRPSRGPG